MQGPIRIRQQLGRDTLANSDVWGLRVLGFRGSVLTGLGYRGLVSLRGHK